MIGLKERIHDLLQEGLTESHASAGGALVKWAAVMELAMPDGSHKLCRLSSDAGGRNLFPWETTGLLTTALKD